MKLSWIFKMAMNGIEFIEYWEREKKRMGFEDDWELMATAFNWREVFGEDLPKDYYHPRDRGILEEAIAGGVN